MKSVCRGWLPMGAFVAALLVPAGPALAQKGKEGEPVKITTVDGVDLHGSFYASPKKDAPTVIVLHKIGEPALNRKDYKGLAEKLQPYCSVMLFDFRGQGRSRDIDATKFWSEPFNKQHVKGAPKKMTLELADIKDKAAYYPAMVNDIAAVKAWLDRKNDGGACNTSSTILIGAEDGATLGAIWLNSQWALHRGIPNPNIALATMPNPTAEGKDVIACVWLSISPTLGGGKVSLVKTLNSAVKANATGSVFVYGEKDNDGKNLALNLKKDLIDPADKKKYTFVTEYEVENTNLKGINLATVRADKIIEYLEVVVDKKGGEAVKRDFRNKQYYWRIAGQYHPAKAPLDDSNLVFQDYRGYLFK